MAVTWLDWFSWTRCQLQRKTLKLANRKLRVALKTPEGTMRILTDRMSAKALEARATGVSLAEYERFLSILFPYFLPLRSFVEEPEHTIKNLRIEREAVQPLLELELDNADLAAWIDLCHEHPLIYIDFPMNSWMIAENVQVSAIFSDNGVSDGESVSISFEEEPRSTITVLLAPKNERSRRRFVWPLGTNRWHTDLQGKEVDDLEGQVPTAVTMIKDSGLSVSQFCRVVERMIAGSFFQESSLRAARMERRWVACLPRDPARQAATLRQDKGEEIRSMFRIERIGIVPKEVRERLPSGAVRNPNGPLLSPHWVRAHWRKQRFGPRLKETKKIWIERHVKGPADGQSRHSMTEIRNARPYLEA